MECASKIVVSSQLERVRCRDSGEESAFALERVPKEQVFSNGHVDFQLFFDVDAETEADVVLGGSVTKRIRAEEVAVVLADAVLLVAVLVCILVIDVAIRVKDGFLAANADNEPIPPDVTFDTEADQATDIGTFIPVLVVFVTGIVSPSLGFGVEDPVMSLLLVPDKVLFPEER